MSSVVSPRTTPALQDVAKRAGVSISTASRCLSGATTVAEATRSRVIAAAEEVGYQYNTLVGQVMSATRRGVALNHLGTVAFVTPVADAQEWRATPTLFSNWQAARERAESFGFKITEFTLSSTGMTGRRMGEILRARGISGVLLAAFPMEPHEVSLPWDDFAFVQVGHRIVSPRLDCVVSDHTEAVVMATRAITARGYSRVGLAIEKYQDEITGGRWMLGYAGLRAAFPGLADIPPLLPARMTADRFNRWVGEHEVDCVLTLSTFRNEPNRMENWLAATGRSMPADVGLVSLDVTSVHQDWSGVEQHSNEIGRAAVDMLFSKLHAGERGIPRLPRTVQVHGDWHEGRTLRRG
ncbi:MAG TPA: LacI family DNA-binding transcriptional regulator [Candidatus Didemnitutus sp.]|nr:LacI family DNA-binding transcriptional regulator [Candidatus Didemnitutus sp.]